MSTSEHTTTNETAATSATIATARQADYVAFLHRHPFATDAHELGFATGVREDYRLQTDQYRNVDVPVVMLDNDFRDPDLDRYRERLDHYEPEVAVLGDAPTAAAARRYRDAAADLQEHYPSLTTIVVPKSRAAFEVLTDTDHLVLGYAMGYSETVASDFTDVADWRGEDVHLLGASPPKQYDVIEDLTRPTLAGDPPANIVGLDWNGPQKVAYNGEYWSRDGWQPADRLSIRETVRRSLREMRAFWQKRNVWPATTPIDRHGPAVARPGDHVWAADGSHITDRDALEDAVIVEYDDGPTVAYRSERERARVEYRSDITTLT